MIDYKSTIYKRRNKTGSQELILEYHRTLFQKLFKKQRTVKTFIGNGIFWTSKETGKKVSEQQWVEIAEVINMYLQLEYFGIKKV